MNNRFVRELIKISIFIPCIVITTAYGEQLIKPAGETIKQLAVSAKRPAIQLPGTTKQLDFEFDQTNELKAWVRGNGEWHIEGWIKHNRFRCGTYRLAVRFGKGTFACSNVNWLSEPKYVTERKQCNQSLLHHTGNALDEKLVEIFDEITCAEILIKCNGYCG